MAKKSRRKGTNKKQRHGFLAGIHHLLAALYYLVKLVLLLWGK